METVSYQLISDPQPKHIITECNYTDTCPGCGAGYRVGLSQCEYCRTPVRAKETTIDKEALRSYFMGLYSGRAAEGRPIVLGRGEAVMPRSYARKPPDSPSPTELR